MKRFRFTLETLLNLRREKEQECEITLARAAGKLKMIEKEIEAVRQTGDEVFTQKIETLDDLQARDRIWLKMVNELKKLEVSRQEAFSHYETAGKQYREAYMQHKTLDRLKERRLEHWKGTAAREEINQRDEVARGVGRRRRVMGETYEYS